MSSTRAFTVGLYSPSRPYHCTQHTVRFPERVTDPVVVAVPLGEQGPWVPTESMRTDCRSGKHQPRFVEEQEPPQPAALQVDTCAPLHVPEGASQLQPTHVRESLRPVAYLYCTGYSAGHATSALPFETTQAFGG